MKKHNEIDHAVTAIERALELGEFVPYGASWSFISGLEEVRGQIDALVAKGEAQRAVPLYEMFLSGCYEKADEFDDSGGNLGDFFQELFCSWISARQKAGCPAEETVEHIIKWMDNDNYGFCYNIEGDVALALDRKGLQVFKAHFEELLKKALALSAVEAAERIYDYPANVRTNADALKKIYIARKDIKSYQALCEKLPVSPQDYEVMAKIQQDKGRHEEALAMVEKGLELESRRDWGNLEGHSLSHMKQELLGKLGRTEEAFTMAWDDFKECPSEYRYEDLMKYVPRGQSKEWHKKAMAAARAGSLSGFIELCVKTKEWEMLAEHILTVADEKIEAISHYRTEKAADGLSRKHGLAAAKIYRALGVLILNGKKSKYYSYALRNFEKARDLYKKAGREDLWGALVEMIRRVHYRKYSFFGDFEKMAAGGEVEKPVSFEERTRRRWEKQMR